MIPDDGTRPGSEPRPTRTDRHPPAPVARAREPCSGPTPEGPPDPVFSPKDFPMILARTGVADDLVVAALLLTVLVLVVFFRPRRPEPAEPRREEEVRVRPYVPVYDWTRDDPDLAP